MSAPALTPNRQLVEAASWRVATELCRRHPGLRILEPHPGVAGTDSLALVGPDGLGLMPALVLDRAGAVELWRFDTGAHRLLPDLWGRYVCGEPKPALRWLERQAGLRSPATMPASTRATLAYRVLPAVATSAVFGIRRVEIRAARTELGPGSGLRGALLAAVPAVADRVVGAPAGGHAVWFVLVDGVPRLAVDAATATVHRPGAPPRDLMTLYRGLDRRLAPVLTRVAEGVLA